MQRAYIMALYDLIKEDSKVVSILSDSGTDYDEMIANEFPNQCLNVGIAEQNQVAVAAGMATCGYKPFVYTSGAFLAYRAYEFIRVDVCMQNRNVNIIGMGSGLSWGTLGPTHHTTEDISVLRSMPNLTILSPATPLEVSQCVKVAYEIDGPVYIRIEMSNERELYGSDYKFNIKENPIIRDGKDGVLFVTGSIISVAVDVCNMLSEKGLEIGIVNVHTIKPANDKRIANVLKDAPIAFSLEEHNVIGGLGSMISEIIAKECINTPFHSIGLNDKFACGYGTHAEVLSQNGLDSLTVMNQIAGWMGKK